MKKTILLITVLISAISYSQEVTWKTIDEAQELNSDGKNAKLIFMDAYTPWCGPCRMMENKTFKDPEVISLLEEHFHAVKFNAEGPKPAKFNGKTYTNDGYNTERGNGRNSMHSLARHLQVTGYPSLIFIGKKGELIGKVAGYHDPERFKELLNKALETKTD
jgi:thioredoxin-related protein